MLTTNCEVLTLFSGLVIDALLASEFPNIVAIPELSGAFRLEGAVNVGVNEVREAAIDGVVTLPLATNVALYSEPLPDIKELLTITPVNT